MTTPTHPLIDPIVLQNFGQAKLSDFLEDRVIYRSLEPMDRRIPGLRKAYYRMGLMTDAIPRKMDRDYAKVGVWLINEMQRLRLRSQPLTELIFLGDTLSGDGHAFQSMANLGEWRGACFIGHDDPTQAARTVYDDQTGITSATRWSLMGEWARWMLDQGFQLGSSTALVVDIDKTALGARGRNDRAIDQARLDGIYRTMDSVLGDSFDKDAFELAYNTLNQARFHPLTGDNQDYLGYICLMLNGCVTDLDELLREFENNSLGSFDHFIRWIDVRITNGNCASESLRQAHEAVIMSVRQGDPTPFKHFRRQEFVSTLEHMNNVPDSAAPTDRLSAEICITQEVRELSIWLQKRGALVLSMSDKPDEASAPHPRYSPELAPIHQSFTHCIGSSIQPVLDELA